MNIFPDEDSIRKRLSSFPFSMLYLNLQIESIIQKTFTQRGPVVSSLLKITKKIKIRDTVN